MKNVIDIFKELESTSSRIDKERILTENADHQELKFLLESAMNPFKIYGIGKKSIGGKKVYAVSNDCIIPKDITEMLKFLLDNNTGTDNVKGIVNAFLNKQTEDAKEWYTRIILKNLRCGADTSTVNKVFGNMIPKFELMLAQKWFERSDKVIGKFIITKKLDGIRCIILKENGNIKMLSRTGQPLEGFSEIIEEAKLLPDNYVYDGELLLNNSLYHLKSKDLYRETMKVVSKDGEKVDVEFHMFDLLPLDEFKNGESKNDCFVRKCELNGLMMRNDFEFLVEVPILYIGADKNKVTEFLNLAIANSEEGVMVNLLEKYQCKRSANILKVKKMSDMDLRVIGFEEGEGRNKGTLGRINVLYKENLVGVGGGFSDVMRAEIWNNKDKYLNMIAKIQYFEISKNSKTGLESLRFPIFLEWRENFDKTEESYN